jgi:hypothetical protein
MARYSATSRADRRKLAIDVHPTTLCPGPACPGARDHSHTYVQGPPEIECWIDGERVTPREAYAAWKAHYEVCETLYVDGVSPASERMQEHPFNLLNGDA